MGDARLKAYFEWTAELFDRARIFDKPEALQGIRVLELTTLILGPATADFLGRVRRRGDQGRAAAGRRHHALRHAAGRRSGRTPRWASSPRTTPSTTSASTSTRRRARPSSSSSPPARTSWSRTSARARSTAGASATGTCRAVNPRLIYVANSGFGQWGPFSQGRASYDAVAQTVSGMIGITGFPGRPPHHSAASSSGTGSAALMAATAALVALHHRRRTGEGQFIDYAQSEGLIRSLDWTWVLRRAHRPRPRARTATGTARSAPPTSSAAGTASWPIAAVTDAEFRGLCQAMGAAGAGRRSALRHARGAPRAGARGGDPRPRPRLGGGPRTRADVEALGGEARLRRRAGRERARTATTTPHLRARGAVWDYEDPLYGPMVEQGPAPKLSATPGRIRWAAQAGRAGTTTHVFRDDPRALAVRDPASRARGSSGRWADRVGAKPPDGTVGRREDPDMSDAVDAGRYRPSRHPPLGASTRGALTDPDARAREARGAGRPPGARLLAAANFAGLFASSILAEFGATVIRIEPPGGRRGPAVLARRAEAQGTRGSRTWSRRGTSTT